MKFVLKFILVIVAFSAFVAATESLNWKRDEPRISPVEKSSSLVARDSGCPSGTYLCSDSEGGCCSVGTSCLPNFQCSGPAPTSGVALETSSAIPQIFSIVLAYLYLV
ncbi:hypothetical protein GLOIN_2v1710858 [Rhizophagus clarus]|uniref:Granulins domain-containing protein n=1 Tax=Rhizophagus clarus TaxID=94130 RepID=A0A140D0A2_9GLOM|nr:hypothetical protein [Rhizophagus clarus]GES92412.1 hypothetical protein GLOIN_2v1710858 [Rhizophagus clarus]